MRRRHTRRPSALTIDAVQKICGEYGIALDLAYRGDRSTILHDLAIEIERIEVPTRQH